MNFRVAIMIGSVNNHSVEIGQFTERITLKWLQRFFVLFYNSNTNDIVVHILERFITKK